MNSSAQPGGVPARPTSRDVAERAGVSQATVSLVLRERWQGRVSPARAETVREAARALGYERVRLDTGARQPHARALYASAGFKSIPDYNDNPKAAYWGEKVL